MNLPVRERKIWIQRHNIEQQRERENDEKKNRGMGSVTGESLNTYAKMTQEKIKNGVDF